MHRYRLISADNGIREWRCDECGRHIAEGHMQPRTVLAEGDTSAAHVAVDSGLSPMWEKAIDEAFEQVYGGT